MPDRNKVIEVFESCVERGDCIGCPYEEQYKRAKQEGHWHCPLYDDAISLLKRDSANDT